MNAPINGLRHSRVDTVPSFGLPLLPTSTAGEALHVRFSCLESTVKIWVRVLRSGSSGSGGKRSFLRRISSNLSQRGFRKSDKDSSIRNGAG